MLLVQTIEDSPQRVVFDAGQGNLYKHIHVHFGRGSDLVPNNPVKPIYGVSGNYTIDVFKLFASALHSNNLFAKTLQITGSKNLIHVTRDGVRATPVYESPEDWLFDMGESETDSNCLVKIPIDNLTYDIMNTDMRYLVELTENDFGQAIVVEQHPRYFVIKSDRPNLSFVWRMTAKRRGYEDGRYRKVVQDYEEIKDWTEREYYDKIKDKDVEVDGI